MTEQILNELKIRAFQPEDQPDIDAMLADIATEFQENIFSASYKKVSELYLLPDRHYLVARVGDELAGTIGLLTFSERFAVIENMFVAKRFRGNLYNVASGLMQEALSIAVAERANRIYLGTMTQFAAAQKFYEKNGFELIDEKGLPASYPGNAMDTVFYKMEIVTP